jgi:NADH dehydrogenase
LDRHLAALAEPGVGSRRGGRFSIVVVGAGLAGLEVSTGMVSRLRHIATRAGSREAPRVVLVERANTVAPDLGANSRPIVETALGALGVEVRTGTTIVEVAPDRVTLSSGEQIDAATTVWTGGLCASDLTLQLPAERDDLGRLAVDEYLRVRGVDDVFAAGDAARAMADAGHVAPMSCQFAMPMGDRAGRNAMAELAGRGPSAFRPPPYVTCLDLGEWGGLFTQGWDRQVHLAGFWGKKMKETINTRMIYPPAAVDPGAIMTRSRVTRPAA